MTAKPCRVCGRPRGEELGFYARNMLTARANGDTLRNGQGADWTPAEARAELLRHGYRQVPEGPVEIGQLLDEEWPVTP